MFLYFINNCFPVSAGDESQILEIEDVMIHPKYDLSNAYQDIAVIKLKPNKGKLQISFTAGWNVWGDWFLAVNHYNYKIWVPLILKHYLWLIFTGMKQKKSKWRTQRKVIFQNCQCSIFFVKIAWIGPWVSRIEIDAKGIDVAQLLWPWGCPT